MRHPIGDIDYIIMMNAHEESQLWEVFHDYLIDL